MNGKDGGALVIGGGGAKEAPKFDLCFQLVDGKRLARSRIFLLRPLIRRYSFPSTVQ